MVYGAGARVPATILETAKTPAPVTHRLIHLVLTGGKELFVSSGHPTIDGRTVGDLMPGDVYNGDSVLSAQRIHYGKDATYDILPSGKTGFYWANGIMLGSTLYHR